MLKYLFGSIFLASTICTSCSNAANPDNARAIAGIYQITMNNAQFPVQGDYLVVTKVDKNTVNIVINYANSSSLDIALPKMNITKNGSTYDVYQYYSNMSCSGNLNNTTFILDMNYTNGNYIHIEAVK